MSPETTERLRVGDGFQYDEPGEEGGAETVMALVDLTVFEPVALEHCRTSVITPALCDVVYHIAAFEIHLVLTCGPKRDMTAHIGIITLAPTLEGILTSNVTGIFRGKERLVEPIWHLSTELHVRQLQFLLSLGIRPCTRHLMVPYVN